MSELKILIADDHPAIRRSIRRLIEAHPGWTVIAELSDGREAVAEANRLQPDVVLLDVTMPEADGLQATREILAANRDARVILLTMYVAEELTAEATRAGAKAVIAKPLAHETLVGMIETVCGDTIHLAGGVIGPIRHLAAFFHTAEERYRVLAPFVEEGLQRGEKAVHIIDPPDRDMHVRSLQKRGVDLDAAEAAGHASLIPWNEAYLREGHFDQYAMLMLIQELLNESANEGFPLTRLVAHMEWALSEHPGVKDLVEYESRLGYVLPSFSDVVICAYDITRFDSQTITDVVRSHPSVLMGESLQAENPLYVPPDRLLPELRRRSM